MVHGKTEIDEEIGEAKVEVGKLQGQLDELNKELQEVTASVGEGALLVVPKGASPREALISIGGILPTELNQDQEAVQAWQLLQSKIEGIAEARKAQEAAALLPESTAAKDGDGDIEETNTLNALEEGAHGGLQELVQLALAAGKGATQAAVGAAGAQKGQAACEAQQAEGMVTALIEQRRRETLGKAAASRA